MLSDVASEVIDPPETVTSARVKPVTASENVKVMTAVWPTRSVVSSTVTADVGAAASAGEAAGSSGAAARASVTVTTAGVRRIARSSFRVGR
jgi:hypothetical protein